MRRQRPPDRRASPKSSNVGIAERHRRHRILGTGRTVVETARGRNRAADWRGRVVRGQTGHARTRPDAPDGRPLKSSVNSWLSRAQRRTDQLHAGRRGRRADEIHKAEIDRSVSPIDIWNWTIDPFWRRARRIGQQANRARSVRSPTRGRLSVPAIAATRSLPGFARTAWLSKSTTNKGSGRHQSRPALAHKASARQQPLPPPWTNIHQRFVSVVRICAFAFSFTTAPIHVLTNGRNHRRRWKATGNACRARLATDLLAQDRNRAWVLSLTSER